MKFGPQFISRSGDIGQIAGYQFKTASLGYLAADAAMVSYKDRLSRLCQQSVPHTPEQGWAHYRDFRQ
jgi:hypothetical protein